MRVSSKRTRRLARCPRRARAVVYEFRTLDLAARCPMCGRLKMGRCRCASRVECGLSSKSAVTRTTTITSCSRPTISARLAHFWSGLSRGRLPQRSCSGLSNKGRIIHTYVDVGANIGLASLLMAEIAPDAKVIAFEPVPRTFKYLEERTFAEIDRGQGFRRTSSLLDASLDQ